MNLEEYREKEADEQMNNLSSRTMRGVEACLISMSDFRKGFDTAIALDLPVKRADGKVLKGKNYKEPDLSFLTDTEDAVVSRNICVQTGRDCGFPCCPQCPIYKPNPLNHD